VDHSARIRSRLDEIAKRLRAPTDQPIITDQPIVDVTPQKASPSAFLAARIQAGKREA
jgi:type IV secretory pathway ATPase VirB11/archaellum biosynthesis ATPase